MNWNQYFKLKQNQKKVFVAFFILIILVHLFIIRSFIAEPDSVCDRLCYHDAPENSSNQTRTVQPYLERSRIEQYLWFDCHCDGCVCQEDSFFRYRLTNTPLFIPIACVLAFIISFVFYQFAAFRIKRNPKQGSDKGNEENPDGTEKKTEDPEGSE